MRLSIFTILALYGTLAAHGQGPTSYTVEPVPPASDEPTSGPPYTIFPGTSKSTNIPITIHTSTDLPPSLPSTLTHLTSTATSTATSSPISSSTSRTIPGTTPGTTAASPPAQTSSSAAIVGRRVDTNVVFGVCVGILASLM